MGSPGTSGSEWRPDDIAPAGLVEGGRGRRGGEQELARRCAGRVVGPPRAAVRRKRKVRTGIFPRSDTNHRLLI